VFVSSPQIPRNVFPHASYIEYYSGGCTLTGQSQVAARVADFSQLRGGQSE